MIYEFMITQVAVVYHYDIPDEYYKGSGQRKRVTEYRGNETRCAEYVFMKMREPARDMY
jgi:hypothetical protein